MPTKSILSFDWMVLDQPCKVHVGKRYNYCTHPDAPACGCDLALPFDDVSTVEQGYHIPTGTYVIIYPVGVRWPGRKNYRKTFEALVKETDHRLAHHSDLGQTITYVVLIAEEDPWFRHIRYMYGDKYIHIKEKK